MINTMDDQIKVLHILDHSLPHQDGYSSRSRQILSAQGRKGWKPFVLTSPKHERECGDRGAIKEDIDGIPHYRSGAVDMGIRGVDELRIMLRIFSMLIKIVRERRPHFIHAHSPVLNVLPALLIGRLYRIPVFYEIRAFWEDAGADQGTYKIGSLKYRIVRSIESFCCFMVAHVFVICNGLKNDLVHRGISKDKISIIYNAINPEEYLRVSPDEKFRSQWNLQNKKVIGFIGSFYRYEGLYLLIKAFQQLRSVRNDVVLLLVGGGEVENELKDIVKNLTQFQNLPTSIIFTGRIPHCQVRGVYALIDIIVYPRYSVRLTELVTPLKPLEAMAMGIPCIATDIGGHRELIRNGYNGVLVPADDSQALSASILNLLNDQDLIDKIVRNGKTIVQNDFTWDTTTSPYLDIYFKKNRQIPFDNWW